LARLLAETLFLNGWLEMLLLALSSFPANGSPADAIFV
jgi:hypothetical protein